MQATLSRILIVDDDLDTLANLSDILVDRGYDVVVAQDAHSALQEIPGDIAYGHGPIQLCLLDFNLPDMNGADLHRRIQDQCPGLRSILITAFRSVEETAQVHAAGAWRVLQKPIDIKLLLELIRLPND